MRLPVNLVTGIRGATGPGAARLDQHVTHILQTDYDVEFRPVEIRWPSPKLHVPLLYSLFLAKTWLWTRNQAVNHITHHNYAHILNWLPLRPCVVSCLDLVELSQLEARPEMYSPHRRRHIRLAAQGILRADHITALSGYTKKTIVDRFPQVESKITVIYGAVAHDRYYPAPADPAALARYGLSPATPYVLYVGTEQERKNLPALVDAFAQVQGEQPQLQLVKVGPSGHPDLRARLVRQVAALGLTDRVRVIDFVAEADLPHLYRGAAVFVFPSLFEGFGLPPLEAMACGAPTICSNATSLPEVVGDAALLVDPHDSTAIAHLMRRVLAEPDLRARLAQAGPRQAQRFTFDAAADALYRIYADLWSASPRLQRTARSG